MAKFITIGYGDQRGYDRAPKEIRDATHEHDSKLRESGVLTGVAGSPVQVRNTQNAGVKELKEPYLASSLPVAGFSVFDAPSPAKAIEMVSKSPCAIAYGVVEVWPLQT